MKCLRAPVAFLSLLLLAVVTAAAAPATTVKLLLGAETAKAGDTIPAGLHLTMEPKWHTYWNNPGESGEPTTMAWTLPPGFTAGEMRWPHPERIPYGELAIYLL